MEEIIRNMRPGVKMIFNIGLTALVIIVISMMSTLLTTTLNTPAALKGWSTLDYDALQGKRDSLTNYMASAGLSVDTTPINQFSVATASFGGIFTEETGLLNPWIGTVSGEAARLQVEAGARAMVLDIWPDPADRQSPIVCAMLDTQAPGRVIHKFWHACGLIKGVGRYSNWQRLTRNKAPVGEILKPALTAAFASSPGPQNTDPFFLILKLHGAMTIDYLNRLGSIVQDAIGGNAMGAEWSKCINQKSICSAPVTQFLSKVFVIVIPDIQLSYNSLPGINTYAAFTAAFLTTTLGELTNALEQNPNTINFEPSGIAAISTASQPACGSGSTAVAAPPQSLAQVGFCLVQPSTGADTTDNAEFYSQNSYISCLQSGAQFVAVNLFSQDTGDAVLNTFFESDRFGKYSFRKI